jgi:hypothetical protein
LLGLLGQEHGVAARALRGAGLTAHTVRDDVRRLVPGLMVNDAEALRSIGIDLDRVRARVEESFGPGALERARFGPTGGIAPFSCRSKKVLELSLREALRLRHNYIDTEHVLLALLREGQGLAMQVLTARGVPPDQLRCSVLAAVGKVA